jgi:tripartite-type tricarboxylate transporter receptor subunit TctC
MRNFIRRQQGLGGDHARGIGHGRTGGASLPVKSVRDLVSLAKRRPGELKFASGGVGSGTTWRAAVQAVTAIDVQHIPYKGGPASAAAVVWRMRAHSWARQRGLGQIRAGRARCRGNGAMRDYCLKFPP